MMTRLTVCVLALVLGMAPSAMAQTVANPGLATLMERVFGPQGLVVDSEARLPDGSTHSGHFNSSFHSNFDQFNTALAGQLTSLPLPSPASSMTYRFDTATGTFARSTQSFGPILSDRAETIGRGRLSFSYNYQFFSFDAIEGIDLARIPAVFTHDGFQQGGGRADVVSTTNALEATVGQFTGLLTFGVSDRIDLSAAIPAIRTHLAVRSDADIQRVGTGSSTLVHFFHDDSAVGGVGSHKQFSASGDATGVGDVLLRVKGTAVRHDRGGLALGLDARLPTGDEMNLLGSGAFGLKPFAALSMSAGRLAPHLNAGYQWNGKSLLAGDVTTGTKADVADRVLLGIGADMGLSQRVSVAFDVLSERVSRSPRLVRESFTASGPFGTLVLDDVGVNEAAFWTANGAAGVKIRLTADVLANFNVRFKMSSNGLTTRVAPLFGVEYGF